MNRSPATSQVSPAGTWISRAAAVTVAGLAGVAGALSYRHMRQLASDHGQAGWHAHAFPLSVDGIEIVASLVLLADRRAGRRSGWLPCAALAAGTAGSLAANIATARPDLISRVIAGWPALALLIALKLFSGLLEHPDAQNSNRAAIQRPATSAASPAGPQPAATRHVGTPPTSASGPPASPGRQTAPTLKKAAEQARAPEITRLPPPVASLLPAARAAMDELHREGRILTRDALGTRLRRHGHPIRNSSLTSLLRYLRHEQPVGSDHEPRRLAA